MSKELLKKFFTYCSEDHDMKYSVEYFQNKIIDININKNIIIKLDVDFSPEKIGELVQIMVNFTIKELKIDFLGIYIVFK